MLKKILIAVDGSPYSTHSLRYLGQLFHHLPDIDFHLLSIVPACSAGSAARDWLTEAELLNTVSPATRNLLAAQKKYMLQATD
ncbi:MAG: universal stress protein, partial [Desulfurivibrionaceae bacterium]